MKAKELIEQLKEYEADAEIFVAYWDRETANDYGISRELTADEWVELVNTLEGGEFAWQSDAANTIVDEAEALIEARDK